MAEHQIGDLLAARWARLIGALIVDELIRADIMTIADNDRAIAIAAEEIYIRVIVAGDRPPTNDVAPSPPPQAGRVRVGAMRPDRANMRGGSTLKKRARRLRGNLTDAEQVLWRQLRRHQLGWRFRRQFPIPPYVVNFACIEARLIVEADGSQHSLPGDHDQRDAELQRQGWRLLRFWNNDILTNGDGVLQSITEALGGPHPNPPPLAGEGDRVGG